MVTPETKIRHLNGRILGRVTKTGIIFAWRFNPNPFYKPEIELMRWPTKIRNS